jgi:hypothetical protein
MRATPALRAALGAVATLALGAGADRALAQGCAMCGTALRDDPVGQAFSWSVLFLMAAPYVVFGLLGGYVFYAHRRPGRGRSSVIDLFKTGRLARRPGGDIS